MLKKDLIEKLEEIIIGLSDENCPILDPERIEVSNITIVNDATIKAFNSLIELIETVKYE